MEHDKVFCATNSLSSGASRSHLASLLVHGLLLSLFAGIPVGLPEPDTTKRESPIHLVAPPTAAPKRPAVVVRAPKLPPVAWKRPIPRAAARAPELALPTQPVVRAELSAAQTVVVLAAAPAPPAPGIRTQVFSGIPAVSATATAPALSVATGSFASLLPAEPPTSPRGTISVAEAFQTAGVASGEPSRARRAVRGAGFGQSETAVRASPRAPAQAAAFPEVALGPPPVARSRAAAEAVFSGVEILFKPQPAYTEQARRRQVEGEVLLEALFSRSGEVRVLRVLRGLGYGLDENAVLAAQSIRFKPALKNGDPVDSTATVQITFQLAY